MKAAMAMKADSAGASPPNSCSQQDILVNVLQLAE
jgi:hypothetical protein